MERTTATLVGGVAALALAVTGCGSEAATSSPAGDGASSSLTSTPSPTGSPDRPEVGDTIPAADLGERIGTALEEAGTVHAVVSSEALEGPMTMDMSFEGEQSTFALDTTMEGEAVSALLVDGVMYLGPGYEALSGGKPFVRVDPEGTHPLSQLAAELLGTMEQSANPLGMFDLSGIDASVVSVQDGLTTYEMALTGEQLRSLLDQVDDAPESLGQVPGVTIRQTVDAEWRIVEAVSRVAGVEVRSVYSAHGDPLDISAPPPDQVGELDPDAFPDGQES